MDSSYFYFIFFIVYSRILECFLSWWNLDMPLGFGPVSSYYDSESFWGISMILLFFKNDL